MGMWLWRACKVAAIGAACLACYAWLNDSGRWSESFTVEPTVIDPFDRPAGSYDLTFRFMNKSPRRVSIVGLESGCADNCCFSWEDQNRFEVPAGETVSVKCRFTLRTPGK